MSQLNFSHKWIYPATQYKCGFCESQIKVKQKSLNCGKTRFLESELMGRPLLSLMICRGCWNLPLRKELVIKEFIKMNKEEVSRIVENKPRQVKGGKVTLPDGTKIDPPPRSK